MQSSLINIVSSGSVKVQMARRLGSIVSLLRRRKSSNRLLAQHQILISKILGATGSILIAPCVGDLLREQLLSKSALGV